MKIFDIIKGRARFAVSRCLVTAVLTATRAGLISVFGMGTDVSPHGMNVLNHF